MQQKNISGRILELAWPIFIGQLAVMLNGLIDTAMAGHYSATDLAAVGIGTSIYISVYIGLMGTLQALNPIVARHYGANTVDAIGSEVKQSYWVALLLTVLGSTALALPNLWLYFIQAPAEVAEKVRAYLYAVSFGLPAALLFRVFYALNTAVARPRVVMVINLCGLAVKPLLNWLFMYQCDWGAAGAAYATALISWLSAALFLLFARTDHFYRQLTLLHVAKPDWPRIRNLLKLGVPIGLSYGIEVTSFTFMALCIARFGTEQSAAHQIIANLCGICYMVSLAFANASSVLVAQSLGAGQFKQTIRVVYTGLLLGLFSSFLIVFGLWWGKEFLVRLYTNHTDVQNLALQLFGLLVLYHVFDSLQCILGFVLRAYQSTLVPMLIYAICCWGIGLGGGWWFAFYTERWAGLQGFWLAGVLSLLMAGIFLFILVVKKISIVNRSEQLV